MNIEEIQEYCNTKKEVTESYPFGNETLVFKVANKIFCLASIFPPISINLKCEPEKAIDLRERYEEVIPGYHMNKKHWNTVDLHGTLKDSLIKEMIDDSYDLVFASLPNKIKKKLD